MASDPPWLLHVIGNPYFRLPNGLDSADADGDDMLDLVGALIHHAGKLPSTKGGSDFPGAGPLNWEKGDQAALCGG